MQVHMDNSDSQKPSLTEMIRITLGQFNNEMFVKSIDSAVDTTDKFARVINYVAQEVVSLYSYLGSKAYHFKRIIEENDKLEKITEDIKRSLNSRDKKNYRDALKKLSVDMHEEVLDFLKIHQTPRTASHFEIVQLFGTVQNPNTLIHGKTSSEHSIEAIAEIRQRYIGA